VITRSKLTLITLKKWVNEKVIPNLAISSAIVMDNTPFPNLTTPSAITMANAPYHKKEVHKLVTM
jgi:hypothetical protein